MDFAVETSLVRAGAPLVYLHGRCWLFALALEERLGRGEFVYIPPGHCALRVDGALLDVRGVLTESDFSQYNDRPGEVPQVVSRRMLERCGELNSRPATFEAAMETTRGAVEDWLDDVARLVDLPPDGLLPPEALEAYKGHRFRDASIDAEVSAQERAACHRVPAAERRRRHDEALAAFVAPAPRR
jgi:hypothetical protein